MVEKPTTYDGLGVRSFFGYEAHNLECFVGEEADITGDHAENVQLQDHSKDRSEE